MTQAGLGGAPRSPLNVKIGPHRRFAWVDGELATFKAIKDALGGTVNDVVLTVVTGALRSHFLAHGYDTDVELKAMVPVSVRADSERGALGNKVAAMYAPLPIGLEDPIARFRAVHDAMRGLKESGQAVGAETLTSLADFAPPTILSQAARIQARAAVLQPDRDERARAAVPAVPARAPAVAALPARADRRERGAGDRDHVLQRADRLRPRVRLRRAAGRRRRRRRARGRDRRAGDARRGLEQAARPARRAPSRRLDARPAHARARAGRPARRRPRGQRAARARARSRGRATPAPSSCCCRSWC